jgi:hypothetical protein
MMMFSAAFVADVRGRVRLPALIDRRTRLARMGRQWKGCCPFHAEKTPSFVVYDDHFHCFGCGAHGDCFAFVMQSEGISFVDAVRQLAAEAGLQPPAGVGSSGDSPPQPAPAAAPLAQRLTRSAVDEEDAVREQAAAQAIWFAAEPSIAGKPPDEYFRGRAIDLSRLGRQPGSLRYHPALFNTESRSSWPALVAAVIDANGASAFTAHGLRAMPQALGARRPCRIRREVGAGSVAVQSASGAAPHASGCAMLMPASGL